MRVGKRVLVLLVALSGLGAFRAGPAAAVGSDLSLGTSVSTGSPTVGSRLTYTHTVVAGSAATNVTLTDMLPPGTTFDSPGSDSRCTVDVCGSTVTCALGSLGASTSVAVAVIPNAAGPIANVAGVAANEYDPVMTNNTSVTLLDVGGAATRCISGTILLNQSGLADVLVQADGRSDWTDAAGDYQICGLSSGPQVVTPTLVGYSFSPPSQNVPAGGANETGVDFDATANKYRVRGRVTIGLGVLSGVTVTACSTSAVTDAGGWYATPASCTHGEVYTVQPSRPGFFFSPPVAVAWIEAGDATVNFSAALVTVLTISPTSGPTAGGTVVTVTGSGFESGATVTFGGVAATNVIFDSPTVLRATTPPHPLAGVVPVVVTNPGGGVASGAQSFEYQAPAATNSFHPITPCRAVDTRNADGPFGGPAFTAGASRTYDLRGLCGIPATAQALEVNFTVVGPNVEGAIQVAPTGTPLSLNLIPFEAGMTRAQFLSVPLIGSTPGSFAVRAMPATANVHLVIDVFGYHAP
jgi:uncharacterized repeat protein (TIGR01451 family)